MYPARMYIYMYSLVQVELPSKEDTFIQISTPKGKKRRRISSTVIEQRLSIIPKLDKSFVQKDEEDFEVSVYVCIRTLLFSKNRT